MAAKPHQTCEASEDSRADQLRERASEEQKTPVDADH